MTSGKKLAYTFALIQPVDEVSEPEIPKSAATPGLSDVRLSSSVESLNAGYRATTTST